MARARLGKVPKSYSGKSVTYLPARKQVPEAALDDVDEPIDAPTDSLEPESHKADTPDEAEVRELISVDAAKLLKVSPSALSHAYREGRMPYRKHGWSAERIGTKGKADLWRVWRGQS